MRISIIGTGYVGLVSGVGFAQAGHDVVCVDVDPERVAAVNAAEPPFHEKDLPELLQQVVDNGRFRATTDLAGAVESTEATFIAVGTPFDGSTIDLAYVRQAALQIGQAMKSIDRYHLVVVKSTVVPGTSDTVVGPIIAEASGRRIGTDFGLAVNPEFLSEGTAVDDFMRPDRLVIGAIDARATEELDRIYDPFPGVPRVRTNTRTAEMIKYASNSVLATLISFSNEIANLCEAVGEIDVAEVSRGVELSQYFGPPAESGGRAPIAAFLHAGCGFGGSCLPKDVKALVSHGQRLGESAPLLSAVLSVNEARPGRMMAMLRGHYPDVNGLRVAVLGLAFKPGTDDIRESPAIPLLRELVDAGATVVAHDPVANTAMQRLYDPHTIRFEQDLQSAVSEADAIMLVTAWPAYAQVPDLVRATDRPPLVIDGRRMLARDSVARYEGIGT